MQRSDRTDEPEESQRSRPSSRRNSVSLPRKTSLKKDKDKRSPLNTPTHSAHSTPKRSARPNLDFMVTGKQILKRANRANSLPGSYRRQLSDTATVSLPRARIPEQVESQASCEPTLDAIDDKLSLDLSQVSDLEDGNIMYGKQPLATSTPKPSEASHKSASCEANHKSGLCEVSHKSTPMRPGQKPRSASLQHMQQRVPPRPTTQQSVDSSRRNQHSIDSTQASRDSTFSYSRDSLYKTSSSASPHRYGTDYSSVSPEYSQSSADLSPHAEPSPIISSCTHSWAENTVEGGEWSSFWANYNNCPLPLSRPLSYDQCPTPYREHFDASDFDTERSRTRSPEGIKHISNIIRSEGLRLTPRDAQRVIHCAHLLGSVLSRAVDARARTPTSRANDKRTLTLDLKDTSVPVKKSETVTTQTDISLPNTKSAPRIFENILRQLSKSSIDEPDVEKIGPKEEKNNENQGT